MARLRLFAAAADAAGRSNDVIDDGTVEELLRIASDRYGAVFAKVIPTCQIWINGEPASPTSVVSASDEVAIIPPVSGG